MAVATGDIWQFTMKYLVQAQTCENVWHLRARTDTSTEAAMKASGQAFWNIYRNLLANDVTGNELTLKRMTPVAFDTLIFAPASGQVGGAVSGASLNNTVALVTTFRTGVSGKRHRGRCYTGGFPVGYSTDAGNRLSVSAVGPVQTVWDDLLALLDDNDGTNADFALGIYSRAIGGSTPFTLAGWQAVEQCVPHSIFGNQRRRRIGVGI